MNIEKYIIDYSKLKVGDKLWSIQLGDCKVVSIKPVETSTFPVICGMRDKTISYTDDGKLGRAEAFPSLFTSNPFAEQGPDVIGATKNNDKISSALLDEIRKQPSEKILTEKDFERSRNLIKEVKEKLHHAADATRYAVHAAINEKSLRYNAGKTDWTLLSFDALKPLVDVMSFGAEKYSRDNWKLPTDPAIPLQSLLRHVLELVEGHTTDKESNLPTIGHVMTNAMFYAYHTIVIQKGGAK